MYIYISIFSLSPLFYIYIFIIYMCIYVARVCVYRADLEAECEWLYDDSNRDSASAEVREAKLKRYGDLCSQGDSFGQALLGYCYDCGWGVSKDWKRAVELFTLSAEQGNAEGQWLLGWGYYNGFGVAQNRDLARQWLKRAAAQGHEMAKVFS